MLKGLIVIQLKMNLSFSGFHWCKYFLKLSMFGPVYLFCSVKLFIISPNFQLWKLAFKLWVNHSFHINHCICIACKEWLCKYQWFSILLSREWFICRHLPDDWVNLVTPYHLVHVYLYCLSLRKQQSKSSSSIVLQTMTNHIWLSNIIVRYPVHSLYLEIQIYIECILTNCVPCIYKVELYLLFCVAMK